MATIFVSSVDGNNADSGADWANAKATVAGALAIAADGDVIKVDSAHSFTAAAAISWTPPAGRVAIVSVNRAGGDAWLAGASESVGNSNNTFSIVAINTSNVYVFGMTINGSTFNGIVGNVNLLNNSSASAWLELVSCTIDLKAPNASTFIQCGISAVGVSSSLKIKIVNSTIIISGSRAGTGINIGEATLEVIGSTISATGGTKPAQLLSISSTSDTANVYIRDCDLIGYAAGAYFNVSKITTSQVYGQNIKLHATPTITTGAWPGGTGFIQLQNVDSGNTIDSFEFRNAYGTLTENASIYAASGANFNSGGISWQIVTTVDCNESFPFITPWLSVWNTVTTAQTATIETIRDNATPLTDREMWLEFSSPNSASFPTGTTATDRNANPFTGSAANQTSSSTSWTGTGGFSNPDKRTVDVAFTTNVVGLVRGRLNVGKASTTLYADAKLRVA